MTELMSASSRRLVHDAVMPFGPHGRATVIHVRAFEHPTDPPVVVIGEFGDYEGLWLANGIAIAAAAVQTRIYPDGRPVRFVQLTPHRGPDHHPAPEFDEVTFHRRTRIGALRRWLKRREHARDGRLAVAATVVTVDGATRHVYPTISVDDATWQFDGPSWRSLPLRWPDGEADAMPSDGGIPTLAHPARVCLPDLLGEVTVQVWPADLYTPGLIGGPAAAELAAQRTSAVRSRTQAEMGFIGAVTDHHPDAIIDLHTTTRTQTSDGR